MPRKASGNFDQNKYIAEWAKENMGLVSGRYKKEFVNEFKTACKSLGITQSEVIRKAMEETIERNRKNEK